MSPRPDEIPLERLLLGAAVAAIVVGVPTVYVGWLTNVGLLVATLAVVAAVAVLAQRLVQSQQHLHWETTATDQGLRRGADSRVSTLRHDIELAATGHAEAAQRIHALLTGLAEDRLRDRRAVERGDDGAQAAAVFGPDLAAYLDRRPEGRLTTDQLHRHVQQLEELS